MKKIYVLLFLVTMLMAACQRTPGNSIVQNKNNGELEAAIEATATPAPEKEENIQAAVTPESKPHIAKSMTNDAETVIINIDADITLPGEGDITVARLERMGGDYFTQERSAKIMEAFFGRDVAGLTFQDPYVTTKGDYESTILMFQKRMTDEEAMLNCDYAVNGGITDIDVIKAHINERIQEIKKLWNEAPEDPPIIDMLDGSSCYGTGSSFCAYVDFGKEFRGRVDISDSSARISPSIGMSAFGGDNPLEGRCFDFSDPMVDIKQDNPDYLAAKLAADSFIEKIGIEGVRAGDVYLVPDRIYGNMCDPLTGRAEKIQISDREFYVFCFERIAGDRTIDFTFYSGANSGDDEYTRTLPYETIKVWVEGNNIVAFNWSGAHIVREIINENAALGVDYTEAMNTVYQQVFSDYSVNGEHGNCEQVIAEITSVEFEMVRLKEKNSNYYISVPAWKFYGGVYEILSDEEIAQRTARLEEMEASHEYAIKLPDDFVYPKKELITWWRGPNIYTINALDGTVIDMEKGY